MERAGAFTAISGWGLVASGVTALLAALVATLQPPGEAWLGTWLAEALIALGGEPVDVATQGPHRAGPAA